MSASAPDDRRCGGDVAAYALGALDADEAQTFRRHLETCSICRDELAAYQGVVDVLPLAVAQHRAPAGLRQRLMKQVRADARAAPRRGRATPRRAGPWRASRAAGAAWRPAPALAALLAVAAVAFGVDRVIAGSGPGGRVIRAQVTGPGSAELRLAPGRADLVVHHFAPPPAGEIYEVWVRRGSQPPSPTTALFSVTAEGSADVGVPGSLHGISQLMVTPEPAGGSTVPTHPPVIRVSL